MLPRRVQKRRPRRRRQRRLLSLLLLLLLLTALPPQLLDPTQQPDPFPNLHHSQLLQFIHSQLQDHRAIDIVLPESIDVMRTSQGVEKGDDLGTRGGPSGEVGRVVE